MDYVDDARDAEAAAAEAEAAAAVAAEAANVAAAAADAAENNIPFYIENYNINGYAFTNSTSAAESAIAFALTFSQQSFHSPITP